MRWLVLVARAFTAAGALGTSIGAILALSAALLLTSEIGWRVARRWYVGQLQSSVVMAVEGVVFSLLGLVLAFAYGDAAVRLEHHRQLAVDEASEVDTVYLALDLLEPPARDGAKELLRRYTDARIGAFDALPDDAAFVEGLRRAESVHHELWEAVVSAAKADPRVDQQVLLPPVLHLSDVAAQRTLAVHTHVSRPAVYVAFVLAFIAAALVGVTTSQSEKRRLPPRIVLAGVVAACLYVVVDLDNPRWGFDQAAEADENLVTLRRTMR